MFRGIFRGLLSKSDVAAVKTDAEEIAIEAGNELVEAREGYDKKLEKAGRMAAIAEATATKLAAAKSAQAQKSCMNVLA